MKFDKGVFKALAMVTQIGISMLTPIFICVAAGYFIDQRFGTNWFVVLVVLGVMAAIRNVYYITKGFYAGEKRQNNEEE